MSKTKIETYSRVWDAIADTPSKPKPPAYTRAELMQKSLPS